MSGNTGGVDQSLKVGGENVLILGVQMGVIALFIYTLILFYVIIRRLKLFKIVRINKTHFILLLVQNLVFYFTFNSNAELYFVSLTTWFSDIVESTYIKKLVEKKEFILIFYYKTALSGLKTYIEELVKHQNHGVMKLIHFFTRY